MSNIIDPTRGLSYGLDDIVTRVAGTPGRDDLNDAAAFLLDVVEREGRTELRDLVRALRERYGIDGEQAFEDVAAFVHQAQVAGLVSMHSPWHRQVRHAVVYPIVDLLMFPARLGYPERGARRRYLPPHVSSTAGAAFLAQASLALVLLVPFAAALAVILAPPDLGLFALAFGTPFLIAMMVAGIVHELAHHAAIRATGLRLHAVYHERFTVGLRRERGRPSQELMITVVGPVASLVVLLATLLWLGEWTGGGQAGFVVRCAVLGILASATLHLACLLPPSADGRALVAAAKALRA